MNILPTLTTLSGSEWINKLNDMNKLCLEEIALFPTLLKENERKKLYKMLEKSSVKTIPYVHLRSDMKVEEIDYLIKKFNVQVFNIHTNREFPFKFDYSKYSSMIYIENIYFPIDEEEIKIFAGICVDFSHLENDRIQYKKKYEHNIALIEKYKIGCNHISAIKQEAIEDLENKHDRYNTRFDSHCYESFSEFDYLKKYPAKYFSDFVAIELENSIEQQIDAIEYIRGIIKNKS